MSDYSSLKATINANIKANNNHEITGAITNSVLNAMVNSLGAGYQFIGVATPTNPGSAQTPDYKCFYLATTPGTYTNLGGLVVADGEVAILKYDTSWTKEVTGAATADQVSQLGQQVIYDVSANNGGVTFASLSELLSSENLSTLIPIAVRCGGMSIRFIQTSDNKYVQFRCIADEFTTDTTQWAICDDGVLVENPEFVYVKADSEGKIIWAIRTDGSIYYGAGCPQQVKDYIEEKISRLSLDEYEDIVSFLSDYLGSDTTLKVLLDSKLNAEGLDPDALATVQIAENQDWISVTTDSVEKILGGRKQDGTVVENCDVELRSVKVLNIENQEWLDVKIDDKGKIIEGINEKGEKFLGKLDYSTLERLKSLILTKIDEKVPLEMKKLAPLSPSYLVIGEDNEGAKQNYCVAVGVNILTNNTGIKNHVIGLDSMANCTGSDNTAMGHHSSYRNTAGECNTAIGSESQDDNTDGSRNSSLGFCSLQRNNIGSYNVAIGNFALRGGIEGTHFDPENLKSFNRNTVVGSFALHMALTGTDYNIAIGYSALASEKVYKNNIAIGNNIDCDKDNQTIIGNNGTVETIVRGELIVKGTDGIKRQIVFNQDGSCSWIEV